MIINANIEDLEKPGVYKILNLVNGKYYIGSTKVKIRLRINHHLQALRNNKHKNSHLQRAWNKYGEDNFKLIVLETCDKCVVYEREQFYLDIRDSVLSYNINPNATDFSESEETHKNLQVSRKRYNTAASQYYNKLQGNEITLDEIPEKYHNSIKYWQTHTPWNKGTHYKSTDHLKVRHKFTEKSKLRCKNNSERLREAADIVYVYDENLTFLGSFRSSADLAELSTNLNLPLKSRFHTKRGKCKPNELQSCNINKAIKTGKTYKGLYFRNKPLHQGIDDANEPKSVKSWNANTEVNTESKKSVSPYSIETETEKSE